MTFPSIFIHLIDREITVTTTRILNNTTDNILTIQGQYLPCYIYFLYHTV